MTVLIQISPLLHGDILDKTLRLDKVEFDWKIVNALNV